MTNKATIEANKADVNEAEDVNKAIVVVKVKAEVAIVADEANVAKANEADKADKADVAENEVVVFVELPVLHPFFLTKCTATFAEVKGCFGIFNNQLGGLTCWIVLNEKQQEILCVQHCHSCCIVMDVKQQETGCVNSCSCNR